MKNFPNLSFSIVLILYLIISQVHVGASTYYLQRPWQNVTWLASNPDICMCGAEIWWNLPSLDKKLETIRTGALATDNGVNFDDSTLSNYHSKFRYHIERSQTFLKIAELDKQKCYLTILSSLGGFPLFPSASLMKVFSNSSGCLSYKNSWKGAVDHYLSAAEGSMGGADRSVSLANNECSKLAVAGMCDIEYTMKGSSTCRAAQTKIHAIAMLKDGDTSPFAKLVSFWEGLKTESTMNTPDFSKAKSIFYLTWSEKGIVEIFSDIKRECILAKTEAEYEFERLDKNSKEHENLAKSMLSDLHSKRFDLIVRAVSGSGPHAQGTISERLTFLDKELERIDIETSEARLVHSGSHSQSYLSKSIMDMAKADSELITLANFLKSLDEDAKRVVDQQMDEAIYEIGKTEEEYNNGNLGIKGIERYEQSKRLIEDGDRYAVLGKQFEAYYKAASLARAARSEQALENEIRIIKLETGVKDLIKRAETDEIEVSAEKAVYEILPILSPLTSEKLLIDITNSIEQKARIKYENEAISRHKKLTESLELAGSDAADLITDLENYEKGMLRTLMEKNMVELDLPDGIGRLKELIADYKKLEQVLEQYSKDIVGNAMSIKRPASFLSQRARLDEPTQITMEVVLYNQKPMAATFPEVKVVKENDILFLFSDIIGGSEHVSAVRTVNGDRTLVITLKSVMPYEIKRIVFARNVTIAHTIARSEKTKALSYGGVEVDGEIDFDVDFDVYLDLPYDVIPDSATIDGMQYSKGLLVRTGKHKLRYSGVVEDSYETELKDLKSYKIGTNSLIEFDLVVVSDKDIVEFPLLVDLMNSSQVTHFTATPLSGAGLAKTSRVSNSTYIVNLKEIKKGIPTTVRVSYLVENSESFVQSELSRLEPLAAGNQSRALLLAAKLQASNGNFTEALAILENAKAVSKKENAELTKITNEYEDLKGKLAGELSLLDDKLESIGGVKSEEPVDKWGVVEQKSVLAEIIKARKATLIAALEKAGNAESPTEKLGALVSIDTKWVDRTLDAFGKKAYDDYNDLKARFATAGNSSTPHEFLELEDDLTRMDADKTIASILTVEKSMASAARVVAVQENMTLQRQNNQIFEYKNLKTKLGELLKLYTQHESSARGTVYSGRFSFDSGKILKRMRDCDSIVEKKNIDFRSVAACVEDLNNYISSINELISALETEVNNRAASMKTMSSDPKLSEEQKKKLLERINSVEGLTGTKNYVEALRVSDEAIREIAKTPQNNQISITVMLITGFAIVVGVGVVIMKNRKPKLPIKKLPSILGQSSSN